MSSNTKVGNPASDTSTKQQTNTRDLVPSHVLVGGPPNQESFGYLSYGSGRLNESWNSLDSDVIIKRCEIDGKLVDYRQTPEGKLIPCHQAPIAFGQTENKY